MKIQKFSVSDASFERSPDQDHHVFVANLVDEREGGPITVSYGLWPPNHDLRPTRVVHDVMIVLEGRLTVTSIGGAATAGPGEIVYVPKDQPVEIHAHERGALTAAVTNPHWKRA